jgi:cell fate regulator YaaT (PSP1 superfamily)
MRHLGQFSTRNGEQFLRATAVVVRSDRGLELGEVLCEATERSATFLNEPARGQVLRPLSDDDRTESARLHEAERRAFDVCRGLIGERGLAMQLVDVEHLFGGERIVFYYLAEDRVDFRELVKALVREYHTRIEMRQIGVRDEAKLLADYGDCGNPVCCRTHLTAMPPVSMRMAKLQKATLDPAKISGRCGRLKCCLRYEYETYEESQQELPPVGARVVTRSGAGRVLSRELLARRVLVEDDEQRRLVVEARDIVTVVTTGGQTQSNDEPTN